MLEGVRLTKQELGFFCYRCGKDISRDLIRCSNCGTPVGFNQNRSGILTGSGTLAIVGACVFLFAGAFSFFFNYIGGFAFILTRDLVWLGILSLISFTLALVGGVLVLERVHLNWIFRVLLGAIIAPILPLIADVARYSGIYPFFGIFSYLVEVTFLIFDLPAICLLIAALALVHVNRKEVIDK
jgi:hypothetical protein